MYDFFLGSLLKYIKLSPSETDLLTSKLAIRKVRKKQWIVTPGEPVKTEYFVNKGFFRGYYLHENGTQHIVKFAAAGWWITDIQSYFTGGPATLYVEALQEGEVIPLHKDTIELLYEEIPQLNRYFRLVYQKALVNYSQRVLRTISNTAAEHYEKLIAECPDIDQKVPQYMIASYLGITPEFFSKIKSQVLKKTS